LNVILPDLDLSSNAFGGDEAIDQPTPNLFVFVENESHQKVLLLVMEWTCPDWFEPTTRRLSLNDPCWMDLDVRPNNINDFEPWSVATIEPLLKYDIGD